MLLPSVGVEARDPTFRKFLSHQCDEIQTTKIHDFCHYHKGRADTFPFHFVAFFHDFFIDSKNIFILGKNLEIRVHYYAQKYIL